MKQITCPSCGTVFKVDESSYAAILEQVRNSVLTEEIERRTTELEKQYKIEQDANNLRAEKIADKKLADKEQEILLLKQDIEKLNGTIKSYSATKEAEIANIRTKQINEIAEINLKKNNEIATLKAQIESFSTKHELDIEKVRNSRNDEINAQQQKITQLTSQLEAQKSNTQTQILELKEQHNLQLRDKQEEIDRLKDFKARISTKMIGESLEQHCAQSFQQMQTMGMFPNASFQKDNDITKNNEKGDFIFRDYINGHEYISIMFEMKNEADTTAAKHKNTDFIKKLDSDRCAKGCEYAVLVSMLEQDNPVYENGIVDLSYEYPKMLVIRPQFFIPLLRILTETAKTNITQILELRDKLDDAKAQSLDVTKLMEKFNKFRDNFSKNMTDAHKKYESAITGIDKVIEILEKQIANLRAVKENFNSSEKNLLKAQNILEEDFTIKKLTHGNPTMRAKMEQAKALSELKELYSEGDKN